MFKKDIPDKKGMSLRLVAAAGVLMFGAAAMVAQQADWQPALNAIAADAETKMAAAEAAARGAQFPALGVSPAQTSELDQLRGAYIVALEAFRKAAAPPLAPDRMPAAFQAGEKAEDAARQLTNMIGTQVSNISARRTLLHAIPVWYPILQQILGTAYGQQKWDTAWQAKLAPFPANPSGFTISGRVLDDGGNPLAAAAVIMDGADGTPGDIDHSGSTADLAQQANINTHRAAVTGTDGRFNIADAPPGCYWLQAAAQGYAVSAGKAVGFDLPAGIVCDSSLTPAGTVTFRLRKQNVTPVPTPLPAAAYTSEYLGRFSPDGRQFAFESGGDFWVYDFVAGKMTKVGQVLIGGPASSIADLAWVDGRLAWEVLDSHATWKRPLGTWFLLGDTRPMTTAPPQVSVRFPPIDDAIKTAVLPAGRYTLLLVGEPRLGAQLRITTRPCPCTEGAGRAIATLWRGDQASIVLGASRGLVFWPGGAYRIADGTRSSWKPSLPDPFSVKYSLLDVHAAGPGLTRIAYTGMCNLTAPELLVGERGDAKVDFCFTSVRDPK